MTMSTIPMEVPERVEHLDGLRLAGDLVAAPDDVADLLFPDVVVDETNASGPNFVETNATWGGLNDFPLAERLFEWGQFLAVLVCEFLALVAEDAGLAVVWVTDANPLVILDFLSSERELDF
jgi:hypothetical protein